MRYILFLTSLLFVTNCYADVDKLNILIRKSDNQVIGVGHTNFEGVQNITEYEVKEISPEEKEQYIKNIDDFKEAQFLIQLIYLREKEDIMHAQFKQEVVDEVKQQLTAEIPK